MAKLYNMTDHDINIVDKHKNIILTIEPSGEVWRIPQYTKPIDTILVQGEAVSITTNVYGPMMPIKDECPNTYYIVSHLVANALPHRNDLLIPNGTMYDGAGRKIGCRSLAKVGKNDTN